MLLLISVLFALNVALRYVYKYFASLRFPFIKTKSPTPAADIHYIKIITWPFFCKTSIASPCFAELPRIVGACFFF